MLDNSIAVVQDEDANSYNADLSVKRPDIKTRKARHEKEHQRFLKLDFKFTRFEHFDFYKKDGVQRVW